MSCKCATFDPDSGRYDCSVSGDGCMYLMPDSKRCAREYGEGPDADSMDEVVQDVPNLLDALKQAQTKLQQHEIVKGVLAWWTYHCGHTVRGKYTEECPVCTLHQEQEENKHGRKANKELRKNVCQLRDRERVLRLALNNIYLSTAKDAGLTMHEVTRIYCCARDALAYNEKPATIIPPNTSANTAFTSLVNKFNKVI